MGTPSSSRDRGGCRNGSVNLRSGGSSGGTSSSSRDRGGCRIGSLGMEGIPPWAWGAGAGGGGEGGAWTGWGVNAGRVSAGYPTVRSGDAMAISPHLPPSSPGGAMSAGAPPYPPRSIWIRSLISLNLASRSSLLRPRRAIPPPSEHGIPILFHRPGDRPRVMIVPGRGQDVEIPGSISGIGTHA